MNEEQSRVIVVPSFVREILSAFDGKDHAFPEWELAGALEEARRKHEELPQDERNGYWAERAAFGMNRAGRDNSPWGTHFGPTTSAKMKDGSDFWSPDIREVDLGIIEYWQRRANEATNPILRARYADLVWDLTGKVTGDKPDVCWAKLAIDEYLKSGQLKPGEYSVDEIHRLERGLELAISIGDRQRAGAIRNGMLLQFHERSQPHLLGTWTGLFDTLYELKKPPLSAEQLDSIIKRLESWLEESVAPDENGAIHHLTAQEAARRLAQHYRHANRPDDVKRVLHAYEQPFLEVASQADTLFAQGQLEQVREDFVEHGLKDDAERIAVISRKKAQEQPPRWGQVSGVMRISKEDFEGFLDEITAGGVDTCLETTARYFVPSSADAREHLESLRRDCPLQGMIAVRRVGDDQVIAEAGSIDDDPEGRLAFQLAENIGLWNLLLVPAMDNVRERYELSAETLAAFLFRSPVFDGSRHELILEGLRAWTDGDHVKAVHVLVPQIENALRRLLGLLGRPTNKHVRSNISVMQEKSLDDALGDTAVRGCLGDDVCQYFTTLLADRRGLNVRNRVAHGLMSADDFGRPLSDRVVHVLLVLGLIRAEEEESGGGAPSSVAPV